MGIPEGEEEEKGSERLFKEIMADNFPNLRGKLGIYVYKANRRPYYLSAKIPSPRHVTMKLWKVNNKEF